MSTDTDVLIIGGGVQGVGVAQAAACAGQRVHLLERTVVAAGTSSKSSKLIHGGLRYLESFQLKLVRESLRERAILLRVAPHLVRLVPFFIPIYRDTQRKPWEIRAGLSLYAILGGLGSDALFQKVPASAWDDLDGLSRDGLRAVYRYFDGQTDDAALCRAVMASAVELGAQLSLDTEVIGGERIDDGWIVRYRQGSEVHETRTRVVVNAAGPWANRVLDRFTPSPPRREIELVGGSHIEVDTKLGQGIYYTEAPADQRAVFHVPWKGRTMVGTTETPYEDDPAQYGPTADEVRYLRETFDHYFPERKDAKTIDAWAGLRVLPKGEGSAFKRPREVILVADDSAKPTYLTIYGGKLTGYRATAIKVMNRLQRSLERRPAVADTSTLTLPPDPEGGGPEVEGPPQGNGDETESSAEANSVSG